MSFRRVTRSATASLGVFALVSVLAGACSDDEPDAAPSPSPTVTAAPAETLAALARAGQRASYTATYALRAKPSGTYVVQRLPSSFRLDVDVKGKPRAILVQNSSGTFACRKEVGRKPNCLKLASGDDPVPARYRAAAEAGQELFLDYLDAFATETDAYDVTLTTGTPAGDDVPAGTCFDIEPVTDAKASDVAAGVYCLSDDGIPTKAEVASGELVLQRLEAAPTVRLTPPAKATPLPRS